MLQVKLYFDNCTVFAYLHALVATFNIKMNFFVVYITHLNDSFVTDLWVTEMLQMSWAFEA